MPNDLGVGSDAPGLPISSPEREDAVAKINAWLSLVSTDGLEDLATFFGEAQQTDADPSQLADNLAFQIPLLLRPVVSPPTESTVDFVAPPTVPAFRSLSSKQQKELADWLPRDAPVEAIYEALQGAIVDYVSTSWRSWWEVRLTSKPENRRQLEKINASVRKLVMRIDESSIRVREVVGQCVGGSDKFADGETLVTALRTMSNMINRELEALSPKKAGAPPKWRPAFDELGEEILNRWESVIGREPDHSKKPGRVAGFAKVLAETAPVQAMISRKIVFLGINRKPLEEIYPLTPSGEEIRSAVDQALRTRQARQKEPEPNGPDV